MKIFIVANSILSMIAQERGLDKTEGPSWIESFYSQLMNANDLEIAYCFPYVSGNQFIRGSLGKLHYYGFHKTSNDLTRYDKHVEEQIKYAMSLFKPDIVHIFGTEFPHTLAAVNAFHNPAKTVIHIQGLCSVIADHYYASLPYSVINRYTVRDFLRMDNIKKARDKFVKRGFYELEALKRVNHVIGRSDLDKAYTSFINPMVTYHFCNETMRNEFYHYKWNLNQCERYSIFFSQAWYPIKGFHYLLKALPLVIKKFPNTHVYVAGTNIRKAQTFREKLRLSSYGLYLNEQIKQYNLENYITFTGLLDESTLCQRLLKSHVFISASTIENSSNSLGEAMVLGVPSIASDVGGIKNTFTHNEDGIIYQHDAWYMLAYYICLIFGNEDLAQQFSKTSREHATITHDPQRNFQTLLNIYNNIYVEEIK